MKARKVRKNGCGKLILFLMVLLTAICQGRTITVDDNGPADFNNIQAAINDCDNGDVVIISPGTYIGTGNRDIDFKGKEIIVQSKDPNDTGIVSSTIIECNGTKTQPHRGFYFHTNEKSSSILSGITINRGGILCWIASPRITNCIIQENEGRGIYCYRGNTIITNCTINKNKGGGIYADTDGSLTVNNCKITNNSNSTGAGISCHGQGCGTLGVFNITNSIIEDNNGNYEGGGIDFDYPKTALVKNCLIRRNTALFPSYGRGGGICCIGYNKLIIANCDITENKACNGGGIIAICNLTIINSNISNNETTQQGLGGGIYVASNPIKISNCTITNNLAGLKGGGIYQENNKVDLMNCIIWGNRIIDSVSEIGWLNNNIRSISVNYCDIKGGWTGKGNINANPLFVDPCNPDPNLRDYHLQVDSPCINTGDPNYVAEVNETDLDDNPRVIYGRIDMGAYEFLNKIPIANAGPDQIVYAYVDGFADVNLDGSGSNDGDGDELTYKWTWVVDGNTYEANGVKPEIELPVGLHTIELIVNDGIEDSLPDYVDVNVVGPVKAEVKVTPQTINLVSKGNWINATMVLPDGFAVEDVNSNVPMVVEPMGTKSKSMNVSEFRVGKQVAHPTCFIEAMFDRVELCSGLNEGSLGLSVVGQFKSGQYFYGSDIIKVIGKKK